MKAIKTLVAVAALAVCGLAATGTAHAQTNFGQTTKTTNAKKAAVLADQGKALKAKGDHDAALEKFAAAIELDATNMTALTGAAWILNEKEKYEEAKVFAAVAALLEEKNTDAWRELGYAEWKLGNRTDAKKYLVQCRTDDVDALSYLISITTELGDTDAAAVYKKMKEDAELLKKFKDFDAKFGK